jgi:hypothetical protein
MFAVFVLLLVPPFASSQEDLVKQLVSRLEIERYKAAIKGLAQFGDRREGTERNRKAVDWIKAQLESYRCFTDKVRYSYQPAPTTGQTGPSDTPLRELNSEPSQPGVREQVFCTKVGTSASEEMYIIGAHMDGQGSGEAADDNGSGAAIVLELARIFSMPDVQTERSIRFVFWNSEESGYQGARAYIDQRMEMQGKEDYPGSGNYPEARWLGLIDHHMVMWDHGIPRADGSLSPEQRPEADINIEFQPASKFGDQSMKLAAFFRDANGKYASDHRAAIDSLTPTIESTPFKDLLPSIIIRENNAMQISAGSNPHWRKSSDTYSAYTDKDFRLGLNAAQTTLAAVAQLAGARLKK